MGVGSAVLCQMPFAAALKHKLIVMDIAANAAAGLAKRKPLLGVLYDELVRKEWEVRVCVCGCVSGGMGWRCVCFVRTRLESSVPSST